MPAYAEPGAVLKKIKDSGEVTLGYRESSIPFSYLDDKAQPVGYSIELCGKVVDAIKAELKMPSLKVNRQAVTSQNRIPLVANGTVQLECGSTVNNVERQAQVSFSVTSFIVATRFVAKKSAGYKTIEDLKGKTVACTSGTNTMKRVRELNEARGLNMTILNGKDHAESMLLVTSGRAEAFFEDDILLTGMVAASADPAGYALSTEGYSVDPYALMFPKDDPEFKRVVDNALTSLYKSGEITKIYDRWFMKPIPPKNIALNFPAGAQLQRVFAKPTDSPSPGDYK
ncbi:MAG TPA: amino acid ABC transporter substrate-binding protein [Burkholderiaceae bacterium]|nr:amino acid ABC transporter substrate-binding protein [Burkholderiaceae bacterium]